MTWKQVTSPPWNGRRLVHSKEMVWASRWSVALRTFYRQILSLLYSSFSFLKLQPPARPGTTCIIYIILYWCISWRNWHLNVKVFVTIKSRTKDVKGWQHRWGEVGEGARLSGHVGGLSVRHHQVSLLASKSWTSVAVVEWSVTFWMSTTSSWLFVSDQQVPYGHHVGHMDHYV